MVKIDGKLEIWGKAQRESTQCPKSDLGKIQGARQEKREGTKSHASVIFHLFVGKPPVNRVLPNLAC